MRAVFSQSLFRLLMLWFCLLRQCMHVHGARVQHHTKRLTLWFNFWFSVLVCVLLPFSLRIRGAQYRIAQPIDRWRRLVCFACALAIWPLPPMPPKAAAKILSYPPQIFSDFSKLPPFLPFPDGFCIVRSQLRFWLLLIIVTIGWSICFGISFLRCLALSALVLFCTLSLFRIRILKRRKCIALSVLYPLSPLWFAHRLNSACHFKSKTILSWRSICR